MSMTYDVLKRELAGRDELEALSNYLQSEENLVEPNSFGSFVLEPMQEDGSIEIGSTLEFFDDFETDLEELYKTVIRLQMEAISEMEVKLQNRLIAKGLYLPSLQLEST